MALENVMLPNTARTVPDCLRHDYNLIQTVWCGHSHDYDFVGFCCVVKWNESGFRPLLCTYRLNWARRTARGWRDEWDDTALQTQDSKYKPRRSEADHATTRSRRLPTILSFRSWWERNIFETGNRTPHSGVKGSGANHYPRAPVPVVYEAAVKTEHV